MRGPFVFSAITGVAFLSPYFSNVLWRQSVINIPKEPQISTAHVSWHRDRLAPVEQSVWKCFVNRGRPPTRPAQRSVKALGASISRNAANRRESQSHFKKRTGNPMKSRSTITTPAPVLALHTASYCTENEGTPEQPGPRRLHLPVRRHAPLVPLAFRHRDGSGRGQQRQRLAYDWRQ